MDHSFRKTLITVVTTSIIISSIFGGAVGFWAGLEATDTDIMDWAREKYLGSGQLNNPGGSTVKVVNEESAVVDAVQKVSPSVVSIIVTKDLPKIQYNRPFGGDFFRQFFGDQFDDYFGEAPSQNDTGTDDTRKVEVGGGSGFIVSASGYVVTNKHVVSDEQADYTVLMNDGKKYPAKVLSRDTVNDLAVLKVDAGNLPTVELGDSSSLKVGQSVIAIGNALGEFRNTVSVGVISGLARSIEAGGRGIGTEVLSGVIQTDASINTGNSGGPLLNIAGQVIGINTAIAQGAQNIGFAIPINEVKSAIESVLTHGRIIRPYIGIRYVMINEELASQNKLDHDYGALVIRGEYADELAVVPGSPADKAGIVENDIILEINGAKVSDNNTIPKLIADKKPGDQISIKLSHKGETKEIKLKLEEMGD